MSSPKANIEQLILAKQQGKLSWLQRQHLLLQSQIAMEPVQAAVTATASHAQGSHSQAADPFDDESDDMEVEGGTALSNKK